MKKMIVLISILLGVTILISSCGPGKFLGPTLTPTHTFTPSPTSTLTPTSTYTSTPSNTPKPTRNPDWSVRSTPHIQISYPRTWIVEDRSQDPVCIPGFLDCLLRITEPENPGTSITLVAIDFSSADRDVNLAEFDASIWELEIYFIEHNQLADGLILVSKEDIFVSGEPAIERVFHRPYIQGKKLMGTLYVIRVVVINDRIIYHLYFNTTDVDQFNQYQELMDEIISSIVFK
jgi:hypothetical protein